MHRDWKGPGVHDTERGKVKRRRGRDDGRRNMSGRREGSRTCAVFESKVE